MCIEICAADDRMHGFGAGINCNQGISNLFDRGAVMILPYRKHPFRVGGMDTEVCIVVFEIFLNDGLCSEPFWIQVEDEICGKV